jgi:hypothetical protein
MRQKLQMGRNIHGSLLRFLIWGWFEPFRLFSFANQTFFLVMVSGKVWCTFWGVSFYTNGIGETCLCCFLFGYSYVVFSPWMSFIMQFKWEFFFFFWHFEPNVFRKTRCLSNGLVYDSYFSEFTYFNIVLYAGRTFFSLANTTQQNDQKPNYKKKKKKKKKKII